MLFHLNVFHLYVYKVNPFMLNLRKDMLTNGSLLHSDGGLLSYQWRRSLVNPEAVRVTQVKPSN